ncbi:hypothetical protein ACQ33O_07255 [Ferruginibacter sp. SUN002]|uniref:hypothetical protein n=1 Tax=Ferruginibacter sp. SUN002 TaxID=2937789 RepID=UPI003D36DC75
MSDTNTSTDVLNFAEEDNSKLPQGLNILTILTFIGCAFALLITAATPFIMKMSKEFMDKALRMSQDMTSKQIEEIERGKQMIELTQQNIVPLTIVGLIGVIACFLGALWMRKRKKDGYWLYVAGEVLPIAGSLIFLGTAQFADWKSYFGLAIPAIFIILYSMQKKYLTK